MRRTLRTPRHPIHRALRLAAALFSLVLFPANGVAQVGEIGLAVDTTIASEAADSLAHSLLWKVTHPDAPHASYVYGTVHLIPESRFHVSGKVTDALALVDRIVFEFDMGDEDFAKNALAETRLEKGTTLRDFYSEERYASLRDRVQNDYGFDLDIIANMKPFYLIAVLSANIVGEDVASYEREFLNYANENGVAIGGLENVQRQFDVVNRIPLPEQAEMLAELIEEPEEARALFTKMYDAYEAQDLARIHAFFVESPEMKKYYDLLLVERNRAWIDAIARHHAEGACFFACGAGHLAGGDGVIPLLRAAGYTVEPE